jgi:hypothetical protein
MTSGSLALWGQPLLKAGGCELTEHTLFCPLVLLYLCPPVPTQQCQWQKGNPMDSKLNEFP